MQGFGVYRFASKYGANVDGYSPIYTPDVWAETGDSYSLGTKGLLAWCVLVFLYHYASTSLQTCPCFSCSPAHVLLACIALQQVCFVLGTMRGALNFG